MPTVLLEEEREEEGVRGIKILAFHFTKCQEPPELQSAQQGRNILDDAEFRSLVERGYIDINDITPKFIKSIRIRHGWENCSATNFCQNYRRVVKTL